MDCFPNLLHLVILCLSVSLIFLIYKQKSNHAKLPPGTKGWPPEKILLKLMRRSVVEFLKPEALQHFIPTMDLMAKEHLEREWSPYKKVKVYPLSMKYTFVLACRFF
ncbi:beta-amyrin 28-monooxygenase [Quercus suber]|uniref:Beta-amyrin 28-monooxygenase n=1 Tax=Quercus suber TaxID=58331 RepID=A0AAW0L8Y1_QUESU